MVRSTARLLSIAIFCLLPANADAGNTAFDCLGVFKRGASHISLVTAFGASNIGREDVFMYGDTMPMTIVFPKDPQRRLAVQWHDDKKRSGLDRVIIRRPANWSGVS